MLLVTPEAAAPSGDSQFTDGILSLVIDESPTKRPRMDSESQEIMVTEPEEASIPASHTEELSRNLDQQFSTQESTESTQTTEKLNPSLAAFFELAKTGQDTYCFFHTRAPAAINALLVEWEKEIKERGYLLGTDIRKKITDNRQEYRAASTILASNYGLLGAIVSDHIRELSRQVDDSETETKEKEEIKKKRVNLKLADIQDFRMPGEDWPALLQDNMIARNFTWTLKATMIGMQPGLGNKPSTLDEATRKNLVEAAVRVSNGSSEEIPSLLSGAQIAGVLTDVPEDRTAMPHDFRVAARL